MQLRYITQNTVDLNLSTVFFMQKTKKARFNNVPFVNPIIFLRVPSKPLQADRDRMNS